MTQLAEIETLNGGSTLATPPTHGGGVDAARRAFPEAPSPWLDLSTGVNPRAYPLPAFPPEALTRLPDTSAFEAAEAAAARAYGAPESFGVVAGAGAQAFIDLLPRVFPARRVATLGFCYAEHAARWRAAGALVTIAEFLKISPRWTLRSSSIPTIRTAAPRRREICCASPVACAREAGCSSSTRLLRILRPNFASSHCLRRTPRPARISSC